MVSLHGISHRRMSGASRFILLYLPCETLVGHTTNIITNYIGASNRSSVDEARSEGAEDESQVVEPEQGNGTHESGTS